MGIFTALINVYYGLYITQNYQKASITFIAFLSVGELLSRLKT